MEASLCLEATERPQWPTVYSLGRPRGCGHAFSSWMPTILWGDLRELADKVVSGIFARQL